MGGLAVRVMGVWLALAAAVVLTGCLGGPLVSTTREATFSYAPDSPIEVKTRNGSVRIERSDRPDMAITAKIKARSQARLDATHVSVDYDDDGTVRVGVDWPDGRRFGNEACSFAIEVPGATGVHAVSSNGAIYIAGLAGQADLETSNGRIEVATHDGPVVATTSNGRVEVRGIAGPARVRTSNGRIVLGLPADYAGTLEARTSNGSISSTMPAGTELVTSTPKHMVATLGGGGEAATTLRTSNGSITIEFE